MKILIDSEGVVAAAGEIEDTGPTYQIKDVHYSKTLGLTLVESPSGVEPTGPSLWDGSKIIPNQAKLDEIAAEKAAEAATRLMEEAKTRLREIDIASIRSIREYIAAKPDAPRFLKDYEAAAMAEREKLKPKA